MLLGVGFLGQRVATAIARSFGGDYSVQSACRKATAGLTIWSDPIGTGIGIAHELSNLWEEADKNVREPRARAEGQTGQTYPFSRFTSVT
jgi:hypothetical protein